MEVPDTRGAGGRAPRGRGTASTPGKLLGIVGSPLQMVSRTVQGLVRKSPIDGAQPGAAAPLSSQPSQPSRRPVPVATADHGKAQIDNGATSFSFPTLAQKDESPPANALLRPALSPQHRPAATEASADQVNMPPPSSSHQTITCKDITNGWSPAKLESLNFFLRGVLPPPALEVRVPSAAPGIGFQQTIISVRPYQGLQSVTGTWLDNEGDGPHGSQLPHAGSSAAPTRIVGLRTGPRYNPYGRPNTSRPPRPGGAVGSTRSQMPALVNDSQPAEALALAAVQAHPSMAVAAAHLPPPHPHPSGQPPRQPNAPGGIRLAPGQVAFGSGRTGTPMPKFGSNAGSQQLAVTPPGGFRPLLGAVGGKRQRDNTPAASPLMTSGIRDLSEFKRRRQALSQQPRSILANLTARTPRETTPMRGDLDRTPAAAGSAGSGGSTGMATPGTTPAPAMGVTSEAPTTETARKILETLDNFARATDHTVNTGGTHGISAKGPQSQQRPGGVGGTPIQGFMPPLDRLDQNQCGRSPSLTPSLGTGATGFVLASPAPPGLTAHAGHTPGPRMALDFQSPAPSPAPLVRQGASDIFTGAAAAAAPLSSPLPLSPITVPACESASERRAAEQGEEKGVSAAVITTSIVAPVATARLDAPVAGNQKRACGSLEASSTGHENKFNFSDPAAPSDPRLRYANQAVIAEAKCGFDVPVFSFAAPTVGVGSSTIQAREGVAVSATAPATPKTPAASVIEEVAKAAATPLPDDDDDESPGESEAAEPAAEARAPALAEKRVSFVETGKEQPDRQATKSADRLLKEASVPASTPPSTPGGFFFSANAGSTPFRPLDGIQPGTPLDTPIASEPQAVGSTAQASIFSFGAPPVAATAVEAPVSGKPVTVPAPSTSTFIFGNQPDSQQPAACAVTTGQDRPVAEAPKPAAPSGFSFGVPLTFSGKDSQPATTASVSTSAPESSLAKTAEAPTTAPQSGVGFSFGAAAPVKAVGEPASTGQTSLPYTFGSSAPAAAAVPASTGPTSSGTAPGTGSMFTFGSVSTSMSTNPPAAASASAPSFSFGAAPSAPPPSFGSPLPGSVPAAPSANQDAQPSGGAGGFGSTAGAGFGAASGAPSLSFSFGSQPSGGSGGGAQTGCSGAFGTQSGVANPALPFSFGAGASAPAFGAATAAPPFGSTAQSSQPSFGSSAPSFGVSALVPANPFGAAAPTFGATASQPSFLPPAASSGSAFGTAAAAPAFGGATIAPTFGSGPAPGPTFGSAAPPAPSFGGSTAQMPSFGGFGNQPNSSSQSPNMFSFGGGAQPTFNGVTATAAAPAFGGAAPNFGMQAQSQPQAPAAMPNFGAAPGGFGGFGGQPSFGAAPPPSPGGDAGGGFSLGHGDPKDGRKRVKARRHGH